MRRRVFTLVLLCSGAAVVWACSLNPQPLPPDTNDASLDGMMTSAPDAGGGVDANGADDSATPKGDVSVDAPEDVTTDAATDASEDASDTDAVADAGEDG